MMKQIEIGKEYTVGWNAAKALGDEFAAHSSMRLEAQGHDWAVFRHRWSLRAYAVTWQSKKEQAEFYKELELCDD